MVNVAQVVEGPHPDLDPDERLAGRRLDRALKVVPRDLDASIGHFRRGLDLSLPAPSEAEEPGGRKKLAGRPQGILLFLRQDFDDRGDGGFVPLAFQFHKSDVGVNHPNVL